MKRIVLFILLIILTFNSFAQFRSLEKRKHSVNKLLKEVAAYPEFKTAGFAFYAIDINTNEIIAELNMDMALKPASTLKLVSTATILELFGPDYQFETKLEINGEVDSINKVLNGNIVIKGGGDPTLGSIYFESTKEKQFLYEWMDAISDLGIDSINGSVIADATVFTWDMVPSAWSWEDMGNYYGAGACGLTVYDNYYTLYFDTGDQIGKTVEIVGLNPKIPNLLFDNSITADSISYDNGYIFGAPYSNVRYLRGQLPVSKKNFAIKGSIPDPAYLLAFQLDSMIKENNIKTSKSASTIRRYQNKNDFKMEKRKTIFLTRSVPLSDIIKQTNTHSINLFAEHCLIQSGIKLGAQPNTDTSIDSLMSFWTKKGMNTQGMALFDGSGLSHYNAVTPRQLVYLLKFMKTESEYFDVFYNSMAIAGETGTLKNMFKESVAYGNIRAKSGTVSRAKAYAGYVTSKSGREIAFSMVVNNFSCTSSEAIAKLEELMVALAEFKK
jgi:D-alanyl-D-alanine carboxypeptidase/D-alanyl-D-alanine-endopeptidase (penicillin-binding protein 4)